MVSVEHMARTLVQHQLRSAAGLLRALPHDTPSWDAVHHLAHAQQWEAVDQLLETYNPMELAGDRFWFARNLETDRPKTLGLLQEWCMYGNRLAQYVSSLADPSAFLAALASDEFDTVLLTRCKTNTLRLLRDLSPAAVGRLSPELVRVFLATEHYGALRGLLSLRPDIDINMQLPDGNPLWVPARHVDYEWLVRHLEILLDVLHVNLNLPVFLAADPDNAHPLLWHLLNELRSCITARPRNAVRARRLEADIVNVIDSGAAPLGTEEATKPPMTGLVVLILTECLGSLRGNAKKLAATGLLLSGDERRALVGMGVLGRPSMEEVFAAFDAMTWQRRELFVQAVQDRMLAMGAGAGAERPRQRPRQAGPDDFVTAVFRYPVENDDGANELRLCNEYGCLAAWFLGGRRRRGRACRYT